MKAAIRIIVVDDEPISADELSDLIVKRFSEQMALDVRTVYNAATVLRMVSEAPCDILISDIQMPGMSGLKLAETLRADHPDMSILFLTGFDDFNYAYEAFRQNAAHYVLKTEGDAVILAAIGEVIERMQNRKRMIERIHEAESLFSQMLPAYRRQQLMQVLLGSISPEGLRELRHYDCEHLYLVIGRADGAQGHLPVQQRLTVLSTVEKTFADSMGDAILWSESFQPENTLAWVFSIRDSRACSDTMFQLVRRARKYLDEELCATLFFVVADESVDAARMKDKYLQLHGMLTHEIMNGATGAAIGHPCTPAVAIDETQCVLRQQLNQCLRNIGDGAFDSFAKHLPPITNHLRRSPRLGDPFAEECSATLVGALLAYVNQSRAFAVLETSDSAAPRGTAAWLEHMAGTLMEESKKQQDYAINSITQFITSYIREHVGDNLSTSHLAEVTGYSSGYLSRVFKQQMNVSIHEYITSVRMDLAMQLLRNTNLRIYEIASDCGYDNTAYFIKVFKSQTGQTPQEFKQDFQAGSGNRRG